MIILFFSVNTVVDKNRPFQGTLDGLTPSCLQSVQKNEQDGILFWYFLNQHCFTAAFFFFFCSSFHGIFTFTLKTTSLSLLLANLPICARFYELEQSCLCLEGDQVLPKTPSLFPDCSSHGSSGVCWGSEHTVLLQASPASCQTVAESKGKTKTLQQCFLVLRESRHHFISGQDVQQK